jgi:sec-independent protein translocase protein TatA
MNLGGLGPGELLLILAIVLVIFGAGRLADIGGSLGKGIREFRKAVREEEAEPEKPATTESTPQN